MADRPAPEAFLAAARAEGRGQLKVFLGAAPGVGKTYEMLEDGAARLKAGEDVVIGVVETHGRAETEALVRPFEIVPRAEVAYQGRTLTEMDLDAVLARAPSLVLVDELAHSNAPGSRHPKRYQDVEELIAAGIDVFSTINIQHIESLNDVVASFTHVRVRETVPDSVLETAEIEVVDLPPDELIERLKAGKVYVPDEASRALGHFFSKSNLQALRELALRRAAHVVDAQMLDHVRAHALAGNFAAGERILVAVSEAPGAAELVRAGKRLADALHGTWTALHIETPRSRALGEAERQRLSETLALAAQLGGVTASIPAANVVDGLVAYATEARITQLVVAKSTRSRWFKLRHGSVVDRLVRETPGMAVHVLPDAGGAATPGASAPMPGPPPLAYAKALGLVAATVLLSALLVPLIGLGAIDLIFLLPVMAAATLYGLRPGLAAGVAASLAFNFFFLPPLYTFTVSDPSNLLTAVVLLGVAVAASQLAGRVRAQADLAASSARQNAALAGFSRALTGGTDLAELAQAIAAEMARLFDAKVTLWTGEGGLTLIAANPPEDRLGAVERAAAQWVLDRGLPAGRGSATLPAADWLFHPLKTSSGVVAVLGLARDDGRDPVRADQLPLLLGLLDQSALAVERLRLTDEMAEVSRLKDRDRLRAALLSSVSHDLRTPLTAVIAATAELRRQLAGQADTTAIDTLDTETQRLARFVANLLDMARVEAGALRLSVEPVDLTDAVAGAVHDLRRSLEGHAIDLDVPPDLPLVRVDPQLFHHILINLLDNAGKYSDPGATIAIRGRRTPDALTLEIIDAGPGLPPGREAQVFETFTRLEGSDRSAGGTGLGLAIVKGFAEAMGIAVGAANRGEPRGAVFSLRFPAALLMRATEEGA
ncbi:sensor histidine kinase KdpD [Glacieibacterium frigidum]|uniref:histidine kinase n=1 Tax=Glacieibacterium frigidum TaxID=2593303 RepID=A0A552UJN4_9SPHN|nr:sensor histidine kinase KdpD [Glacieibacterium frigidum]TRW18442.1 sensor histidine kinase KdpD [Glacieibacterium frigidum]